MWGWFLFALYALGLLSAIRSLFETRTAQGAAAWALSLVLIPYVALPLYWFLGRSRFDGYRFLRRRRGQARSKIGVELRQRLAERGLRIDLGDWGSTGRTGATLERLARMHFTRGNDVSVLVDGVETFEAIQAAIERAQHYLLVEFYTLNHDRLGQRFADALLQAASRGVRVYLLYDEVGSYWLSPKYIAELRSGGVRARRFDSSRGRWLAARLNYRNHRKIVVVDGTEAFVGGHNVADIYLGKAGGSRAWRDTHLSVTGPAALGAQVAFAEDWLWSSGEELDLTWDPEPAQDPGAALLFVPSGPADTLDTATLMMLEVIGSATSRLWLVSPYFAPEPELLSALQLAALRGVDVRILLPEQSDAPVVHLASYAYLNQLCHADVKVLRYQGGVLHQKVMLVDEDLCAVGTANFDNRSMRLNFELTAWVHDRQVARTVESMLLTDFAKSRPVDSRDYSARPLWFRLAVRTVRLFSPIL